MEKLRQLDADQISEFIHRRFPDNCHWLDGNCYWFAVILSERFNLTIYYLPVTGHFVAGKYHRYFDWTGEVLVDSQTPILSLRTLYLEDTRLYRRLTRDCMN